MIEEEIIIEEKRKLYSFVPSSLVPIIVITFIILTILFFDVAGGYQTNPVIFYALPFLYLITFMTVETPITIMRTIGFYLPTARSKIIAVISVAFGGFLGWGLVNISRTMPSIFPIATYPWVASSYATAGLGILSTLTPATSFFLYLIVAIFEEGTAVYLGKNAANWLYSKGMKNTIWACILGFLIGRVVLTLHHWFSYMGFQQPYLYVSAFALFTIFTVAGIITGIIIKGEKLSELRVVPISIPIMIAAHFAFDYTMSMLMTIP